MLHEKYAGDMVNFSYDSPLDVRNFFYKLALKRKNFLFFINRIIIRFLLDC